MDESAAITRRAFGRLLAAVAASTPISRAIAQERPSFTSISYNILACRGYPHPAANPERIERQASQNPDRTVLELALYAPDILTLQEAPPKESVARIAAGLGMNFAFFDAGWEGNAEYPGGFPGAVITRFPIRASKSFPMPAGERLLELFTRHWGVAELDLEGDTLHVFSAHLHPSEDETRVAEIRAIIAVIRPLLDSGADFVLQGDLNHTPEGPEYALWIQAGLVDCLAAAGAGNEPTFPSTGPRRRIDYIWASPALGGRVHLGRVLNEGAFRSHPDDAQSVALSDHLPVLARFV